MALLAEVDSLEKCVIPQMLPHPYLIQRVHQETSDTFTLEIVPADGGDGLTFMPGQFNMLYVFGVGEVPISISGDPGHPHTLVHTTRAVGTVTKAMRQLRKGDVIGIRGPFGTQWPVDRITGRDVVITAGGIGLAPLRPAIYQILNHRDRYGKVVLLYGTRSPGDILFRRELETWRSRFDLEVHITVDRAVGDWRGNVGVITTLIPRAPFDPHNAVALICGPEIMMRYSVKEFAKRGMSYEAMYVSMERNMKCAIGFCGHCQYGHRFICKDGPVFRYDVIDDLFTKREV